MSKFKKILKSKSALIAGILVLQVVVGAVSGAVAGWIVSSKILPDAQVDLLGSTSTLGLFTTSTDEILVNQNDTTSSSIKLVSISSTEIAPRVVPNVVLDRKSPVAIIFNNKLQINYGEKDELARAVAVTSDGWFAAPALALEQFKSKDVVVMYEQNIYKIEQIVNDKASGVLFIKTNASHLPVASFAQYYGQRVGIALWIESRSKQFVPTSLIAARANVYPEPRLSDQVYRRLLIEGWLNNSEAGSPIWDSNGSLVGIVESGDNGKLELIPAAIISSSLQSLVSNGQVKHAALGVYTVNLSLLINNSEQINLPERGVLISDVLATGLPTIIKNSVAEKAGLKVGDVILQVDRDIIDESSDLGDIILQFHPGADVDLRVWRDGSEMEIPITLGEQVTSKILP